MGILFSYLGLSKEEQPEQPPPQTPINSTDRLKNILLCHFRGIFGMIGIAFIVGLTVKMQDHAATCKMIWLLMIWCIILQPIHSSAVGFIPLSMLPLFGALSTNAIMSSIMNQGTFFFVIGGYLIMIFNCTGLDKRLTYIFLTLNPSEPISLKKLMFRVSFVSYLLGAFSSRIMSTEIIMNTIVPSLQNLQSATAGKEGEVNYGVLKYQICNAIASSSCLGSLLFIHSSPTVMAFKAMYEGVSSRQTDTFNYLAYTMFALPFTVTAFLVNLGCNIIMCTMFAKGNISLASTAALSSGVQKAKEEIPPRITCHEIEGIVAMAIMLVGYFSRWFGSTGWSIINKTSMNASHPPVPLITDVTWAVIMLMILVNVPNSCDWIKKINNLTVKEYKSGGKPTSAILFWRVVDKATSYAHMFLICGGIALCIAIKKHYASNVMEFSKFITNMGYNAGLLIILLFVALAANIMPGIASVIVSMPFVLYMVDHTKLALDQSVRTDWENRMHLAALGIGIASSFGFCARYRLTPMYYSYTIGKVPERFRIRSAILSVIMCTLILYLFLAFYGPLILKESYIYPEPTTATTSNNTTTTTAGATTTTTTAAAATTTTTTAAATTTTTTTVPPIL